MRLSKGALLASAVAAMVVAVGCGEEDENKSPEPSQQATQTVKCYGINECKGKTECAGVGTDGKEHACQGQNACKGQGWISIPSEKECTDKGGSTTPPKVAQGVPCEGINECAGKGECAGKNADGTAHDCAGKGSCKGQGWITVPSEKECTDKGGTVKTG
jgi:hypothetical protein